MDVDRWLALACTDAEQRGLPELRPLLETLAHATRALRSATALVDPTAAPREAEARDEEQAPQ
jgi:hypothetical protein